jgi:hypothetical protein
MEGCFGDFKQLFDNRHRDVFVDKSLLIRKIIDSNLKNILITRPRRWGKTINMSMLFYFFANREQLKLHKFSDEKIKELDEMFYQLKIFTEADEIEKGEIKQHMGKYPTIFLKLNVLSDFLNKNSSTEHDWDKVQIEIESIISSIFIKFDYLYEWLSSKYYNELDNHYRMLKGREIFSETTKDEKNLEKLQEEAWKNVNNSETYKLIQKFNRIKKNQFESDDLTDSISFLSNLLWNYHKTSVIVLIDEYDSLFNFFLFDEKISEHLNLVLTGLFSKLAKPSTMILTEFKYIIFTGIMRIAKANIFSPLNNICEFTVFSESPFSEFYGFTAAEVEVLLKKAGMENEFKNVEMWYNGYIFGSHIIYNPWSLINFVNFRKLDNYWLNTGNPEIIEKIITKNKGHSINRILHKLIKHGPFHLEKVIIKEQVTKNSLNDPDVIWSLMIQSGYLTIKNYSANNNSEFYIRIPNREIWIFFLKVIDLFLQNEPFRYMINNIFNQDYEYLAENIEKMLLSARETSLFSKSTDPVEEVYHSLLLNELNKEFRDYISILPEEQTGNGRTDILLVNELSQIVVSIELKRTDKKELLNNMAKKGIEQSAKKYYCYDKKYDSYLKRPYICISFCGTDFVLKLDGIITIQKISKKRTYEEAFSKAEDSFKKNLDSFTIDEITFKERVQIYEMQMEAFVLNISKEFNFEDKELLDNLAELADIFGMKLYEVNPNGYSLFFSIEHQLSNIESIGKQHSYDEIKNIAIEELSINSNRYSQIWNKKEELINLNIFTDYIDTYKVLLLAISRSIRVSIIVLFSGESEPYVIKRPFDKEVKECPLIYIACRKDMLCFSLIHSDNKNAIMKRKFLRLYYEKAETDIFLNNTINY